MKVFTAFLFCCTIKLAISGVLMADEKAVWTQFRGPVANPVSDSGELPDRWSRTENVSWSTEIAGRGWSSPLVLGNRVYVTTAVTAGESKKPQTGTEFSNDLVAELSQQGLSQEEIIKRVTERDIELPEEVSLTYQLHCLDLASGQIKWSQSFYQGHPPSGRHRKNSFTSETPVTDGERIYIYVGNLGIFVYDLEGQQVWNRDLPSHKIYFDFGTGSSPALCDDQLIIISDNEEDSYIAAFNKHDGSPLWQTSRKIEPRLQQNSGWVTPFIWRNSLRTEIIAMAPGVMISYDTSGQELWRLSGLGLGPAASSFAVGEQLIVNGGRGRAVYCVRAGGEGDIALPAGETTGEFVVWSRPRAGTYIPTPVAYQGGLYILADNGILTRLDLATGEESYKVRIRRPRRSGEPATDDDEAAANNSSTADFTASPWACDGKIFLASEQGDIYVIKAAEQYELLHVNSVGELIMASPALLPNQLLLRTENRLLSITKPVS